VAYVRTVKTSSGATAVQIVWSWRKGSRSIEHLGSAHDDVELLALKTAAAERLAAGQTELDPARRYRTVRIKAGAQILTAADPLPDDLRDALIKIRADGAH
jgi:hypothetical protein